MAGIQVVGNANNTTAAEVEVNTKAARVVIRPDDFGNLGIYNEGANNGTTVMTAGLAANSSIFQFRNGGANLALVKKVLFTMGSGGTGFAVGSAQFNLFAGRSWSVAPSGGTSVLPTGNSNKLRTTGMGTTSVTDIRISATGALTDGTVTVDGQPLASISVPISATANNLFVAVNSVLLDQRVGEYPLVLANNEGFLIRATVPITGTWFFGVNVSWEELTAY